jgi:hypothetical protein
MSWLAAELAFSWLSAGFQLALSQLKSGVCLAGLQPATSRLVLMSSPAVRRLWRVLRHVNSVMVENDGLEKINLN